MLTRRTLLSITALGSAAALLASCSPGAPPAPAGGAGGAGSGQDSAEAISHVHGVVRDPGTGAVVLATHQGAYHRQDGQWVAAGAVVDLMGFAVAPDGTWFASGHPGPGVDLPQPLGLASSTDGGRTWNVESRGGESDFHALAAGPAGIIGFDGTLRISTDRKSWTDLAIPAPPHSLAVSPGTGVILATTEQGLLRSADHGRSWTALTPPTLVALIAWADEQTIVGVTVEGLVVTSTDAGTTWTSGSTPLANVTALAASRTGDAPTEILIVSGTSVLVSTDSGATTTPLA